MHRFFRKITVKYWKNRGLNFYVRGDFSGAKKCFLKIENHCPQTPGIAYNLGLVELGLGNYETAEAYLTRAVSEDSAAPALRSLADLYYIWGKRDKALVGYLRVDPVITHPREKILVTERIAICRSTKTYETVQKSYSLLQEGTIAMQRGDVESAQKAFMGAVKFDPTNYVAANNLGSLMLNERKNGKKALRWFEQAARFWDSPVVKNNVNQARTALKEGAN